VLTICCNLSISLEFLGEQIVCRTQASVHAAYHHAETAASIVSVYAKLRGAELATSQALVRSRCWSRSISGMPDW
jgi:hypothetical protein